MKKLLFTFFALLSFAGVKAQVTETDLSQYNDVVYMPSCEFLVGTGEVNLPINVKSHLGFTSYNFGVILPENMQLIRLNPVSEERYNKDSNAFQSVIHAGNDQTDGSYDIAGTIISGGIVGGVEYDKEFFYAGDSEFCSLKVNLSQLPVGEYPLIVKAGARLSGFEDGTKGYTVETVITTKLVITDEVVIDENATEFPGTYSNTKVKVLRTISAGNWNTICLPFDMSETECKAVFGNDVQIADFDSYNETYDENDENVVTIDVIFNDVTSIEANHPYIIKVSNRIEEFHLEGKDIVPEEEPVVEYDNGRSGKQRKVWGQFYGTYVANTVLDDPNYLFLSGNKFYYSNGSTSMKGLRGYFSFVDVLADKSVGVGSKVRFTINSDATGIDNVAEIEKMADGVYTVSGVKVSDSSLEGLPKGVYIVNGKKVLVK